MSQQQRREAIDLVCEFYEKYGQLPYTVRIGDWSYRLPDCVLLGGRPHRAVLRATLADDMQLRPDFSDVVDLAESFMNQ